MSYGISSMILVSDAALEARFNSTEIGISVTVSPLSTIIDDLWATGLGEKSSIPQWI
jgi:hypothetical protein